MKLLLRGFVFAFLFVVSMYVVFSVAATEMPEDTQLQFLPVVIIPTPSAEFESVIFASIEKEENALTDIQPLGDGRLLIARQSGIIHVVDETGTVAATPFLDIRDRVTYDEEERGLYELAFHPNYAQNGYFYLVYAYTNPVTSAKAVHISRFTRSLANPEEGDAASELILLSIPKLNDRHHSGSLAFGPLDGYLYVSIGDDLQPASAQQGDVLTGKLLRIDVDSAEPYAIPPDNSFVDNPDVLDEIWAMGLRNPWGINFDDVSGDLYIADVGSYSWEEVNFQSGGAVGGANYGWPCYEGFEPGDDTACEPDAVLTSPIHAYGHVNGRCAITGGHVYRGQLFPDWKDNYLFADFCTGELFTIVRVGDQWQVRWRGTIPWLTATLGYDAAGELYAGTFVSETVYKLLPIGSVAD